MMDREWRAILNRYGHQVLAYPEAGAEAVPVRAFLQPVREKGEEQRGPSPLGLRRDDRFLYLGPPGAALTARASLVEWDGWTFEVQAAQAVDGGGSPHHWWAVLRPRDREAVGP